MAILRPSKRETRIRSTRSDTLLLVMVGLRLVLPILAAVLAGAFIAWGVFSLIFL